MAENIGFRLNDTLSKGNPTYLASPLMDSHVEYFPQTILSQTDPSMNEQEENISNDEHEIVEPLATIEASSV